MGFLTGGYMLFADDITSALFGAGGVGLLTLIGGAVAWWFNRKDKNLQLDRDAITREEETALDRLRSVMELREADCNRRIVELTHRIEELERRVDSGAATRDLLRERLALQSARNRYLESILRQSGIKVETWQDASSDTYPAVNLPDSPETPKGGHPK